MVSEILSFATKLPNFFVTFTNSTASGLSGRGGDGGISIDSCSYSLFNSFDERFRMCHGPENSSLHLDHLQRREIIPVIGRARAIGEDQALIAPIVCFAHGCMNTHICRDTGQDDVLDAQALQEQVEV